MLTARKMYDQAEVKESPKRRKKVKVNKLKVLSIIALFFSAALCFTAGTAIQATKVNQINDLKSEVAALESTNERLELKKARLLSLNRIENIAMTELGMIKPEKESVQLYSVEQVEEITLALKQNEEMQSLNIKEDSENPSQFNPYVAAISSLMSNWLITR